MATPLSPQVNRFFLHLTRTEPRSSDRGFPAFRACVMKRMRTGPDTAGHETPRETPISAPYRRHMCQGRTGRPMLWPGCVPRWQMLRFNRSVRSALTLAHVFRHRRMWM